MSKMSNYISQVNGDVDDCDCPEEGFPEKETQVYKNMNAAPSARQTNSDNNKEPNLRTKSEKERLGGNNMYDKVDRGAKRNNRRRYNNEFACCACSTVVNAEEVSDNECDCFGAKIKNRRINHKKISIGYGNGCYC